MGARALGVGVDDPRGLTVTGGLPYAGGPGNDYTTHGIASMVTRLRASGGVGLCTGLGGWATKHAAGVYAAAPGPGVPPRRHRRTPGGDRRRSPSARRHGRGRRRGDGRRPHRPARQRRRGDRGPGDRPARRRPPGVRRLRARAAPLAGRRAARRPPGPARAERGPAHLRRPRLTPRAERVPPTRRTMTDQPSVYQQVFGVPAPAATTAFAEVSRERVIDGLWERGGIGRRDRRLLTLAVVASSPNDAALEAHLDGALRSGDLTPAELDEVAVHLAHYAGWPVGARLSAAVQAAVERSAVGVAARATGRRGRRRRPRRRRGPRPGRRRRGRDRARRPARDGRGDRGRGGRRVARRTRRDVRGRGHRRPGRRPGARRRRRARTSGPARDRAARPLDRVRGDRRAGGRAGGGVGTRAARRGPVPAGRAGFGARRAGGRRRRRRRRGRARSSGPWPATSTTSGRSARAWS